MKDIFGYALYSYWKGDHRTLHVIRRDDDQIDESPLKIYFTKTFRLAEKTVLNIAKGKILDVGCGVGRHVLNFQNRGFDITGIDSSPLAIKVCKERGCKKAKIMNIFHPKLSLHSFDTLLLFGNNIGIGGNLAGAQKLLSSLRKLVKPKGLLLLTTIDVTKNKKKVHKMYHQENLAAKRYVGEVKIRIEYKGQIGDWFSWLHIEPRVLQQISQKTGWKIHEIHPIKGGEYAAVLIPV